MAKFRGRLATLAEHLKERRETPLPGLGFFCGDQAMQDRVSILCIERLEETLRLGRPLQPCCEIGGTFALAGEL